jgi:hypothetical protein
MTSNVPTSPQPRSPTSRNAAKAVSLRFLRLGLEAICQYEVCTYQSTSGAKSSRPWPARSSFWLFRSGFKVCPPILLSLSGLRFEATQSPRKTNKSCHQRALWCNGLHTGYILLSKSIYLGSQFESAQDRPSLLLHFVTVSSMRKSLAGKEYVE